MTSVPVRLAKAVVFAALLLVGGGAASSSSDAEWNSYEARYITPDGRVIDTGNGGVSHSEGQGYGMLLAVAHGDRARFRTLWDWTQKNLQVREDKLFAWRWEPQSRGVSDNNSASDGDILIAWALARAADTWDDDELRVEATAIAQTIREKLVRTVGERTVLLPGPEGFESPGAVVVNPSYWVFPAFAALDEIDPSPVWGDLAMTGHDLLRDSRFGAFFLPPDWLEINGGEQRLPTAFPTEFGYNAMRIPLYLTWAGYDDDVLMEPYQRFWSQFDGRDAVPATVDLKTGRFSTEPLSRGGYAVLLLTRFGKEAPRNLPAMLPSLDRGDDYYSATLLLLSKLAFKEKDTKPCSRAFLKLFC